jgi:hypothetical protein
LTLVEDDDAIKHSVDIEGVGLELIDLFNALSWHEKDSAAWFAEFEAGYDRATVWLYQLRLDLTGAVVLDTGVASLIPFGTGRNFPVPVSRMTAGFITPVLTEQFGAPIVLDELSSALLCSSKSAPPPTYVASCVRTARQQGLLSFSQIESKSKWLDVWWREICDLRDRCDSLPVGNAFVVGFNEARRHMSRYFANPLFRQVVGTEYLLESHDLDERLFEDAFQGGRSGLAARLYTEASLTRLAEASQDEEAVFLYGDDSLGTPRLVQLIASRCGAGEPQELIDRYFDRDRALHPEVAHAHVHNLFGSLDEGLEALLASLWYQEQDNQYKDALYHILNSALYRVCSYLNLSIEDARYLYPGELEMYMRGAISVGELHTMCRVRRGTGWFMTPRGGSSDTDFELRVRSSTREPSGITRDLEVVRVMTLSEIGDRPEFERQNSMYVLPAATPLGCLDLPAVAALWLYELGDLAHAAHILRARRDISVLIFGQEEAARCVLGRVAIVQAADGLRINSLGRGF